MQHFLCVNAFSNPLLTATPRFSLWCALFKDDDVNYTRFMLLARQPVSALIPPEMKSKTTLVFLIDDKPGSLYRALACFALRDIDLTKCESRPTSVQLLNYLAFSESSKISRGSEGANQRRFR